LNKQAKQVDREREQGKQGQAVSYAGERRKENKEAEQLRLQAGR